MTGTGTIDVSLKMLENVLLDIADGVPGVDRKKIEKLIEDIRNGTGVISLRELVYRLLDAGVPVKVIVTTLKGVVFEREDELGQAFTGIAEEEFEERIARTSLDYILQIRGEKPWT